MPRYPLLIASAVAFASLLAMPLGTTDAGTDIHAVLHLPEDWRAGRRFPVIVELPGNNFFTSGCYSTGRPEQFLIGHGIARGRAAICLGMPFIDRGSGTIAESGWGNPDDTVDYVIRMVDDVCQRFGGDRDTLVLTGFSRGALACGFIGLRNDHIATLRKGFHACQHYDGDGWGGATAMFLDDRESTRQLRQWFEDLTGRR
jgi:hypothetical protein